LDQLVVVILNLNKVGDGDTGDTFARGAAEIMRRLSSEESHKVIRTANPGEFLCDIADTLSDAMGGSSGAVLEIFFRSAGIFISLSLSLSLSLSVCVCVCVCVCVNICLIFFHIQNFYLFHENVGAYFQNQQSPTIVTWINSFDSGSKAIQFYGGATEGMRTLLDALIPAIQAAKDVITTHGDHLDLFQSHFLSFLYLYN
jgi:hypothetical protein